MDDRILYVENIPLDTTEETLLQKFKSFGQIKKLDLPKFDSSHPLCRNASTPRSKGYAFIEFSTKYEADEGYRYYNDLSNFAPKNDLKNQTDDGQQPSKRVKLTNKPKQSPLTVLHKEAFNKLKKQYEDRRRESVLIANKLVQVP